MKTAQSTPSPYGRQILDLYLIEFFVFLQSKLFPTIYIYWKKHQSRLLERIKTSNEPIKLSGDTIHNSMGHNPKYGAYPIYFNTLSSIVHLDLVQVIKIYIFTVITKQFKCITCSLIFDDNHQSGALPQYIP